MFMVIFLQNLSKLGVLTLALALPGINPQTIYLLSYHLQNPTSHSFALFEHVFAVLF